MGFLLLMMIMMIGFERIWYGMEEKGEGNCGDGGQSRGVRSDLTKIDGTKPTNPSM